MNTNKLQPQSPVRSHGHFVCSLESALCAENADKVGGKATNLAEMTNLGMDVHPGS